MGLFDKKYCDICGEKIGLLGNRKLDDGNCCKDCAGKLSPFFNERRHSTIDDIKNQLAYRAENERQLASFRPTKTIGRSMKVMVDEAAGKFIVTRYDDFAGHNPDIIELSQVRSCNVDVQENKTELYMKDKDGKNISYNPPRYEYDYAFYAEIGVDSPWFDTIRFELSEARRPERRYSPEYRQYEDMSSLLTQTLLNTSLRRSSAAAALSLPFASDERGVACRVVDRASGIDFDVTADLSGVCSYQITDQSAYAACGASLSAALTTALSFAMLRIELPDLTPEQFADSGSAILNEMKSALDSARFGVELTGLTFAGCKARPESEVILAEVRKLRQFAAGGVQMPAAPAAAVSGKWICPACQGENSGKFCEYCGSPKP